MRASREPFATSAQPPVPPPAPLAMPVQDLRAPRRADTPASVRRGTDIRTSLARLVTFGGAALLTAFATDQMIEAVAVEQVTALQWVMVVLFVISFAWIALSATSGIAGLLGTDPERKREQEQPLAAKTALIMPVYNENPAGTATALAAMASALVEAGHGAAFELFLLSDTTAPDVWIQETAAVDELRRLLSGQMAVWYRRRYRNTARKAGNLKDFVERWGGRYEFMIVLDADSIMAPETLITLVRRMQANPSLGLLQTVPVLAGGQSLYARLQQFAGRIYGPVVARGLAAWQGDDGNYWGHNAIVRVKAFADACGLPELPGRKPFGGAIMSHDFVEAALLRRAGWAVRMAPGLGGSWEDSPPSLLDVAARDRRWAQGNLQHLKVLPTRGLVWPSRVHFLTGVMSYLASPLWLALIVVGIILTLQASLIRPEFFTEEFQLFPTWPEFDAERMIWLFVFTMGVLLLPKFIGLGQALTNRELRRATRRSRCCCKAVRCGKS
jgi:membrane glycosyltransferase